MFNFMVDALEAMLAKANEAGHIQGVVPHLFLGGITHLQYVDDTMVMIEPTDMGIDIYARFYSCRQCWASKCRGL
jgi:hypothetical protein